MIFGSDNWSGVHPDIMAALMAANEGMLPAYGHDALTGAAEARLREVFAAPDARIFLLGSGTATNALTLAQLCPPFGRIFCHRDAHIETSEANAPGFMSGGAQTAPISTRDGRISPKALSDALAGYPQGDAHDGVNAVLSLTNVTEWGTVYAPGDVAALASIAHEAGMHVYLDGARFANALAATGASPADLSWRAGVDAMGLGASKNGCLALEAVIFFDPDLAARFEYRRMQAGHLWSKHRYLSAQMLAWLSGDLWLKLATHANQMATALTEGVATVQPVQANLAFLRLTRDDIARLREAGLRAADWPAPGDDSEHVTIRLVTSWATTEDQISAFRNALGC